MVNEESKDAIILLYHEIIVAHSIESNRIEDWLNLKAKGF